MYLLAQQALAQLHSGMLLLLIHGVVLCSASRFCHLTDPLSADTYQVSKGLLEFGKNLAKSKLENQVFELPGGVY